MSLNKMFNPKSIAIIGVSNKKGSVGLALYANALQSAKKLLVYPVNIKGKKILGTKSFLKVSDIGKQIDLAVIATPAMTVPSVLQDCSRAKIKEVVIISAGFNEAGVQGEKLFEEVREIARKEKIRILGPNCLGFINPQIDLNMSFAAKQAQIGQVAFVSQSGAMCTAVLDWASQYDIGFSKFISIGSSLDVGFSDLIEYLDKDKNTKAIVLYMESLKNSSRFIEVAKKVSRRKPIFALKSGRSSSGASAAKSHTGSLTGNDKAIDALFRQSGVVRLDTIQDIYNVIKFASFKKNKIKKRLTIITNAGGPGVIATDAVVRAGGTLAKLSKKTIDKLNKKLPSSWSRANPVDIIGDADPERFKNAVEICLGDVKTDSVLVLLTPQAMTSPMNVAKNLLKIKIPKNKFLFTSFIGGEETASAKKFLLKNNIAVFETPERAINSFVSIVKSEEKKSKKANCLIDDTKVKRQKKKVEQILNKARLEKRKNLNEAEAKELLRAYKVPVASFDIVSSLKEVDQVLPNLSYPVAMKILSSDILHKIDCGGVELDITSEAEAKKAYTKIMKSVKKYHPQAHLEGVYIETMKQRDVELIVGLSYDPVLGPILMFGRGGSEVELYQDVSFGVLPLDKCEIIEIIKQTKVYKRLVGYRGLAGVDFDKLVEVIYRVSLLARDFPIIKELDINPLIFEKGKIFALDAKIILK